MSAPNQESATRAFALEALAYHLRMAVIDALAAKLDQSVVSELKHLQGVVEFNKFVDNETFVATSEGERVSRDGRVRVYADGTMVVEANREAAKYD